MDPADDIAKPQRPSWVVDAERTPQGSLLVVKGFDGKLHGYRMPTRSRRDGITAALDNDGHEIARTTDRS